MALLPALVDPKREAVDVGANVGHYSLRLSRLVGRVHAFEPHPRLAYVLKQCLPANVIVHNEAVSDRIGEAVLVVPFFERPVEGMASLSLESHVHMTARGLTRIGVSSTTLDSLAGRDVGFIKIDVEGHEMSVLFGAHELIIRRRPRFLVEVEERHRPGSVKSVFEYFAERDYAGFFAFKDTLRPVDEFSMAYQNENLVVTKAARMSYDYVNNFIFVPRETEAASSWLLHVTELLVAARAAA